MSNMDFPVTKGVLNEDVIARDEMEDNLDDYTSNSKYVTLAMSKFPNLQTLVPHRTGLTEGVPMAMISHPSAASHSNPRNSARQPGNLPSIRPVHPLISNFRRLVQRRTSRGINVTQSL